MSNTPRTLQALLELAADNNVGAISAQDLRDMLVSLYPSRGALELITPAATNFAQANQWTRLAGVTALVEAVCTTCVTMTENNALELTKPVSQVVLATAAITFTLQNNGRTVAFTFGKNGTPIERAAVSSYYGVQSSGQGFGLMTSTLFAIEPDDQIELYIKNVNHTDGITATAVDFSVLGFIR